MRVSIIRYLMPLTLLVAGPLLGGFGRAQAGYMTPASFAAVPLGSSPTDAAPQAGLDEMGASAQADASVAQTDSPCVDPQQLFPFSRPHSADLQTAEGATDMGCQGQPTGDTGGHADAGQTLLTACHAVTDAPVLVGVLFLEVTLRQPPAFPSRLFRPPRLA